MQVLTRETHRRRERTEATGVSGRPAIAVSSLTKRFRDVRAVDDLSFTVSRGTITGFLGPNGAGKTTTIRTILGLIRPDSGDVRIFDRTYPEITNPLSRVGAVIDGASFHPMRTARAHVAAVAAAGDLPPRRVNEVLAEVDLAGNAERRVGGFSLGMRQRLALATALLGDPELLILDEPANGLDPAGIRWLRTFLRSFAASGKTVFVSSHVLAEVAQTADEVVVIDHGRLVTHTTVAGLTAATSVIVRSPQPELIVDELGAAGGTVEQDATGALEVTGISATEIGEIAARERIVLHELTPRTHSLEEIFLRLTEGGNEDVVG